MNNITKYLPYFLLVVAIIFAIYYYSKFQKSENEKLDPIENREEERVKDIDSIIKAGQKKTKSIDSLTDIITKLENYEPPKIDNTDLPSADSRKLDSILTSYYNR